MIVELESAMDICSPQQMELPLKAGEKPVKIKGGFDKSVVITGKVWCNVCLGHWFAKRR